MIFSFDIFKQIIVKIIDVLIDIKSEKNSRIRTFILDAKKRDCRMYYPYFETEIIIEIIFNVVKINTLLNESDFSMDNIKDFYNNFLKKVYDSVAKSVGWKIVHLGNVINGNKALNDSMDDLCLWFDFKYSSKFETKATRELLSRIINVLKQLNNDLESTLPEEKNTLVYVKAHSEGFKRSRKSYCNTIDRFTKNKSKPIFTGRMLKCLKTCFTRKYSQKKTDLKKFMNKPFSCSKSTAIVLMTLFHYYSEIHKKHTTYEIMLKEDNKYQIKWSYYGLSLIERVKKRLLEKEISDLSGKKIIHKIGLLMKFGIEYSTLKPNETEDEPLKERLTLFSCGHQFSFELVDELFEFFYDFKTRSTTCYICKHQVEILGSYDANIYVC
jgi:hypothetical protein